MLPPKKVLLLRGGALGDFLLTLPAIELMRRHWPDCEITLVGNASAAQLALLGGELKQVYSQHEGRWSALYGTAPLPASLREWLCAFDLILSFWSDPEQELSSRFPLHSDQHFLQASPKPQTHPAALHFCEPLAKLGIKSPSDFAYRLKAFPRTAPLGTGPIAIHPGSSSKARNWPAMHWVALCQILMKEGHSILLITGEADEEQKALFDLLPLKRAENLPLPCLAKTLADCSFYLGHDTGVSHLAAALALPSLILFGPSDPDIWAPQGPKNLTLRPEHGLGSLQADTVFKVLHNHPAFASLRPQQ